jgi:selenocysteine-specific elongation factor
LQSHRSKIEEALPGRRVAVNLGGLATEDVQRGDVVTVPAALRPTTALDVRLRLLADAPRPLANATSVGFHSGTAEAVGKVTLLEGDALQPGGETWAQVRLRTPVAVAKNDLFIIRQLSPGITLGGGQIVDPAPVRRHRRRQQSVIAALETLARGSPEEVVLQTVELKEPSESGPIVQASGLDTAVAKEALETLERNGQVVRLGPAVLSASGWRRIEVRFAEALAAYHRQFPLRAGMPREELRSRAGLTPRLFNEALARLSGAGRVAEHGATVRLSSHEVTFSPAQERLASRVLERLDAAGLAPPTLPELRQELAAAGVGVNSSGGGTGGAALDEDFVGALALHGKIVRLGDDLIFAAPAYNRMVERLVEHLRSHGTVTVAQARDLFGTSRRYVLPLLEHLDQQRVTRRQGDERVLGGR